MQSNKKLEIFDLTKGYSSFLIAGKEPELLGNDNFTAAPSGTFSTKDGLINIAANEDKQWVKLCEAIKREDLLRDERFLDREKRKINRDLLNYILTEVLKENTTNYWVKLFEKYDIPCGEILNLKEVFNLEHTKQRNMIIKLKADYIKEDVKIINIAPKFSNIENFGTTPPPKLGEHSELVLSTL